MSDLYFISISELIVIVEMKITAVEISALRLLS